MRKHVMALTYPPKIEPVQDGRCTQTIRKGRGVSVGDEILFHGWSGRPCRSKWDWRKRVTVVDATNIKISKDGILYLNNPSVWRWHEVIVDAIAEHDFINPPTGEALRDVLFGLNGAPGGLEEYQIIRWAL